MLPLCTSTTGGDKSTKTAQLMVHCARCRQSLAKLRPRVLLALNGQQVAFLPHTAAMMLHGRSQLAIQQAGLARQLQNTLSEKPRGL